MTDGDRSGRREFFRTAGRCLVLVLAGAGTALFLKNGKIDPSAPRCHPGGGCVRCPARKGCARIRQTPPGRKDAHGGA